MRSTSSPGVRESLWFETGRFAPTRSGANFSSSRENLRRPNRSRPHLGGCRGAFPEKHRQIGGRRAGARHLVEEVGDEAAVIARVVDDVEQDLRACHDPLVPADQGERHVLAERGLGQTVAPGDVPLVHDLLLAPQLVERRWPGGGARGAAVLPPLPGALRAAGGLAVLVWGCGHVLVTALPPPR